MWFVYIVECADNSYYTGITDDVGRRLETHNAGRGAKYTRSRRPVALIYSEPYRNKGAALRREHSIKQMSRTQKEQLIRRAGH